MKEKENNAYNEYNETYNLETPIKEQDKKIQNVGDVGSTDVLYPELIDGHIVEFCADGKMYDYYYGWLQTPESDNEKIAKLAEKMGYNTYPTMTIVTLWTMFFSTFILSNIWSYITNIDHIQLANLAFIVLALIGYFIFHAIKKKINTNKLLHFYNKSKEIEESDFLRKTREDYNMRSAYNRLHVFELSGGVINDKAEPKYYRNRDKNSPLYEKTENKKALQNNSQPYTSKYLKPRKYIFNTKPLHEKLISKYYIQTYKYFTRWIEEVDIYFYADGTAQHKDYGYFRYADYNDPALEKLREEKELAVLFFIIGILTIGAIFIAMLYGTANTWILEILFIKGFYISFVITQIGLFMFIFYFFTRIKMRFTLRKQVRKYATMYNKKHLEKI